MSTAQTVATKGGKKKLNERRVEISLPAPYTQRQLEDAGQTRLPFTNSEQNFNTSIAFGAWYQKNKVVQA